MVLWFRALGVLGFRVLGFVEGSGPRVQDQAFNGKLMHSQRSRTHTRAHTHTQKKHARPHTQTKTHTHTHTERQTDTYTHTHTHKHAHTHTHTDGDRQTSKVARQGFNCAGTGTRDKRPLHPKSKSPKQDNYDKVQWKTYDISIPVQ